MNAPRSVEAALEICSSRASSNVWAWETNHFGNCAECQRIESALRAYAAQETAIKDGTINALRSDEWRRAH